MGVTEFLAGYITQFIDSTGYISVFILMIMESMVFPIPSEAVMPFAGFLIVSGRFTFANVIIVSTVASIIGSLLSYYIGKFGGKPFISTFGKFFLINHDDLAFTEKFFAQHGDITILICRFIPIVRHLISIPAGTANMNIFKFIIYTTIGAGIWNAFLTFCGFFLKQNWEAVMKYARFVDIAVLVLLVAAAVWFVMRHLKHPSKAKS